MSKVVKVGTVQFQTSSQIAENLRKAKYFIEEASNQNVRVLLFPECSLCGYPPVEIDHVDSINYAELEEALFEIDKLSKKHNMYIAVGYVHVDQDKKFNSIKLISPKNEELPIYHKRALWGWDTDNFEFGSNKGIYEVDGIKIGIRICFDIRFPELFKELFLENVDVCLLSLCDTGSEKNEQRRDIIRAHMITRAVENVMYFVSSNSISTYPTAPTCIISCGGKVLLDAGDHEAKLIVKELDIQEPSFGQKGIIFNKRKLL